MKLAVATVAVVVVALAVLSVSSCSVRHKSGDFECSVQADCDTPRQCLNGYCVVPGGSIDAPRVIDGPKQDGAIDSPMPMCPSPCTSCSTSARTCTIDCALTNCNANNPVVCPSGWNCTIACSTNNACSDGIDCTAAKSCAITCGGSGSCRNIECGTGDCDVKCTGSSSCRGVDCGDSCACDVTCGVTASCELLTCSSVQCDPFGKGCTSIGPTCDSCP